MKVLYLHCHDMGRYNQIYGYNINTPNIFAVAKDSTVFRNAYCACPTSSPSRGALLTGMYPHNNGLIGLAHRGFSITDPKCHLAGFLSENGYVTALAGIQHETYVDKAKNLGYRYDLVDCSEYDDSKDLDRASSDAAADFIREHKDCENVFLSCGFKTPHREYFKHTTVNPDYVKVPECLPDNAKTRSDFADYIQTVSYMDECAGKVIDALKETDTYDDTLIILTTDHGIAFPNMKCNLYDTGTGVTLAIKLPHQREGKVTDALCSHIDIFPTLCEILGLQKPDYLQGISVLPILHGEKDEIRDKVFFEVTYHAAYEPLRAIRTKKYALIKRYDKEMDRVVLANIDDGKTKSYLIENGLGEFLRYKCELYDLDIDPSERNNIYDDEKYREIRDSLEQELYKFQTETNDPILQGYIKKPEGARINLKNCVSPTETRYENF